MGNDHRIDRLVAEIAACQHGVVSGRQMRWAGVSKRRLSRWTQRSRVFSLGWVAYAFVPRVDDLGRLFAALLSAGADRHLMDEPPPRGTADDVRRATRLDGSVVLGHWSSLRVHRVTSSAILPVDVTVVGRETRPRIADLRGHRARHLDPADVVVVEGVPTTTVARALVDVALSTSAGRLRRLVREAQFLGLLPADELAATCARLPWHPGVRALATSDPDLPIRMTGDSPLGGDLGVFLEHETALGPWTAQHPVTVPGRIYHLDYGRPDLRFAVEADGAGAHDQSQGRTHDARRDAALLAEGWVTARVTAHRLEHESEDLRSTLHAIAAGRGWSGPPGDWRPRSAGGRSAGRRPPTDRR